MGQTPIEAKISTRNAECRQLLLEARQYRMEGRPDMARSLEREAAEYRGETLRILGSKGKLNSRVTFA
jgi:hypothetical protein